MPLKLFPIFSVVAAGNVLVPHVAALYNIISATKKIILDDGSSGICVIKEGIGYFDNNASYGNPIFSSILKPFLRIRRVDSFYTIFKSQSKPTLPLEMNDLQILIHAEKKTYENSAVVIGSPFVEKNVLSLEKYANKISYIFSYLYKEKSIRKFYYKPHPCEIFFKELFCRPILKHVDIEVLNTSQPYELFLSNSSIRPKIIVGIYSTLLYSVSIIDPEIEVINFGFSELKTGNKEFNSEIAICDNYNKEVEYFKTIHVDDNIDLAS